MKLLDDTFPLIIDILINIRILKNFKEWIYFQIPVSEISGTL